MDSAQVLPADFRPKLVKANGPFGCGRPTFSTFCEPKGAQEHTQEVDLAQPATYIFIYVYRAVQDSVDIYIYSVIYMLRLHIVI